MEIIKIHLIEDDHDDIFLIKDMLLSTEKDYKFEIKTSNKLTEAEFELQNCEPDLILLDLSLPDGFGMDLVQCVRNLAPNSDLIVLTGNTDQKMAFEALKLGASDYLNKGHIDSNFLVKSILYSRERRKLEGQLRQSQKMEAIGQLAGGIAHDFNNQLGIMNLLTEEIKKNINHKSKQHIDNLSHIISKCKSLTSQILSFSHKQTTQVEALDVCEVINGLLPFVKRLVGSNIAINFDTDENCNIEIDRIQLEQIIWNIIINSKDAISDYGEIDINVWKQLKDNSQQVCISITDNGSGISEEIKSDIFKPFFTTKEAGVGTGLGLANVYNIVHQCQAEITVDSEVDKYTTFTLIFPFSEKAIQQDITKLEINLELPKGKTVLVCDDEEMLLDLTSDILESAGLTVLKANSGAQGYEFFLKHQNNIDLVVTDMTMPLMDGVQMIEKIETHTNNIPTIFVSGFTDNPKLKTHLERGKVLLDKPYSQQQLISCVSKVLNAEQTIDQDYRKKA